MNNKFIFDWVKKLSKYSLIKKLDIIFFYRPSYHNMKNFIKHYVGGLINRTDEHHVFLLAGGLAFSLFVCIIPFFLIIFAVLGNLLNSQYMQQQVNAAIDALIPYYKYSAFVKKIIFSRINEVIEYKNIAGIIGALGLFFAASGLFSSMRTILNRVFGLENNVHFLIGKLRDLGLVILVIIIFFLLTVFTPLLDLIRQAALQWNIFSFLRIGFLEHFIFTLISVVVIFIVFTTLYITVPFRKLSRKATLLSAFWAALLWEVAKQGFGFYIHHFTTFGRIYGTYALVVVVAFWIYYSSIVFIIGAEIGRLYSERKLFTNDLLK